MNVNNFHLLPAGFSNPAQSHDSILNEGFSNNLLDGLKLILSGFVMRLKAAQSNEAGEPQLAESVAGSNHGDELTHLQRLIDYIENNSKTRQVKMGGVFPLVVAQKAGGL